MGRFDIEALTPNNRMQPDFGELALSSAADAKRYATIQSNQIENL